MLVRINRSCIIPSVVITESAYDTLFSLCLQFVVDSRHSSLSLFCGRFLFSNDFLRAIRCIWWWSFFLTRFFSITTKVYFNVIRFLVTKLIIAFILFDYHTQIQLVECSFVDLYRPTFLLNLIEIELICFFFQSQRFANQCMDQNKF